MDTVDPKFDEWNILDIYFRDHIYAFNKHHLDSFRQFIKQYIPETIQSYNPITMIKFEENSTKEKLRLEAWVGTTDGTGIYVDRPVILDDEGKPILLAPNDARLRNLTYSTKIYADIELKYYKDGVYFKTVSFPHTLLGSIPLMLHSDQCMLHGQGSEVLRGLGECQMDPGGYFIVDGKEKVIISQERITTNRLFVSLLKDDQDFYLRGYIQCTGTTGETALSPRTVELKLIHNACFFPRPPRGVAKDINAGTQDEKDSFSCSMPRVTEKYEDIQGAILVSLPSINGTLPITTVFRALGIESDKDIIEAICGPIEDVHISFLNFLRPSLVHGASTGIFTTADAHENLRMRTFYKSIDQVKAILTIDVFPNIEGGIKDKAVYFGYLISIIMKTALNIMPPSDRDSYIFKRVDISGILLAHLFKDTYAKFRKDVRDRFDYEYNYGPVKNEGGKIENLIDNYNLHKVFPNNIISDIFTRSLKGMWGPPTDDPEQGLVQDLSRISYIGFMSHLRRVNMPLDRTIKITSPHRLHIQQWGIMCPFESPDGASIGYLKNFALMTQITSGSSIEVVSEILIDIGVYQLSTLSHVVAASPSSIKVFINGIWFGITHTPHTLVRTFRLYRRNGLINPFISVAWNIKEGDIRIQTEPGRPCRPLFIVKDGTVLIHKKKYIYTGKESCTWFDLLFGELLDAKEKTDAKYVSDVFINPYSLPKFVGKTHEYILDELEKTQSCIEYLDIEEENTLYLAMKPHDINAFHTHVEIHPSTVFSIVTHIVPFANHNTGTRVLFHAAQSKQALGIYATNFNKRFDTNGYIHHYPQKRIVTTRGSHYNGNNMMPNGTNVIVAIATYTGYNQEDSIIINRNSIDRGLFHTTGYKTMVASEKTLSPNERVMFANPITMRDSGLQIDGIKHANYKLLDPNGIIKKDAYVPRGQEAAVIGMVNVREIVTDDKRGVLIYNKVEQQYNDVSLKTDVHYYGKIDKVYIGNPSPVNTDRICKVKFRKVRRPELGDKHCLTPDHEVLTNVGWKFINTITMDDLVCTLNDGLIQYAKPLDLIRVQCTNTSLYCVTNDQIDLQATLDHSMWTKISKSDNFKLIKTRDIIGYSPIFENKEGSIYTTPHDEKIINYTGNVYCIEVPSHVFYVRRNNKAVWTGNCSAHGQKGVVGMILPQHAMPFSKNGIVPDLIINPHAIPTRMTIGHIVETIMAKVCCMEGVIGDGSVFIPLDQEALYDNLEAHNFNRHGNEVLYNGMTGRQIDTEIFIGPIYYYRLKHMVADKIHARSTGGKVQLTHQPTSGRSAGGGLRIGEMERDSLLCHGLAQFSKECMMEKSDKFKWAVCKHCGTIANYNPAMSIMNCGSCNKSAISVIETPYCFKLLIQEMEAMGVSIRLTTEVRNDITQLLTDIDVDLDELQVVDDPEQEVYSFENQERERQELEESLRAEENDLENVHSAVTDDGDGSDGSDGSDGDAQSNNGSVQDGGSEYSSDLDENMLNNTGGNISNALDLLEDDDLYGGDASSIAESTTDSTLQYGDLINDSQDMYGGLAPESSMNISNKDTSDKSNIKVININIGNRNKEFKEPKEPQESYGGNYDEESLDGISESEFIE